jgi:hypothetical protein
MAGMPSDLFRGGLWHAKYKPSNNAPFTPPQT